MFQRVAPTLELELSLLLADEDCRLEDSELEALLDTDEEDSILLLLITVEDETEELSSEELIVEDSTELDEITAVLDELTTTDC
jgi:hypothetical protein